MSSQTPPGARRPGGRWADGCTRALAVAERGYVLELGRPDGELLQSEEIRRMLVGG